MVLILNSDNSIIFMVYNSANDLIKGLFIMELLEQKVTTIRDEIISEGMKVPPSRDRLSQLRRELTALMVDFHRSFAKPAV